MTDPTWANLRADREGRVYRAPTLPFGWFDSPPGVNRLMGETWPTAVLYRGKADVDLRVRMREFYRLFYQVGLPDEPALRGRGSAGPVIGSAEAAFAFARNAG